MPDDAPTPRQRLPNRRENETIDLVQRFDVESAK